MGFRLLVYNKKKKCEHYLLSMIVLAKFLHRSVIKDQSLFLSFKGTHCYITCKRKLKQSILSEVLLARLVEKLTEKDGDVRHKNQSIGNKN